jgi:hypothetical protein
MLHKILHKIFPCAVIHLINMLLTKGKHGKKQFIRKCKNLDFCILHLENLRQAGMQLIIRVGLAAGCFGTPMTFYIHGFGLRFRERGVSDQGGGRTLLKILGGWGTPLTHTPPNHYIPFYV